MTSPVIESLPTGDEPWAFQLLPWLRGMGNWGDRSKGKARSRTDLTNVWLEEVSLTAPSRWKVEFGKIDVTHRPISDWGQTTAHAVISYSVPQAKDGRYRVRLAATTVDLDITLRPRDRFKTIEAFEPFYRELMGDYGGDRVAFCRAKGMRLDPAYNEFGTMDGVLYHELTHGAVALRSAAIRWRKLLGALSGGNGFDSPEEAVTDLRAQVSQIWKGFRGQLLHGDVQMDEVYVWEKECRWYIKAYEKWSAKSP